MTKKTKHTPGPWTAIASEQTFGHGMVTVTLSGPTDYTEWTRFDVDLVNAAPEMFDALLKLKTYADNCIRESLKLRKRSDETYKKCADPNTDDQTIYSVYEDGAVAQELAIIAMNINEIVAPIIAKAEGTNDDL